MADYKIGIPKRFIFGDMQTTPGNTISLVKVKGKGKFEIIESLVFDDWEQATYAWTVWGIFLRGETL